MKRGRDLVMFEMFRGSEQIERNWAGAYLQELRELSYQISREAVIHHQCGNRIDHEDFMEQRRALIETQRLLLDLLRYPLPSPPIVSLHRDITGPRVVSITDVRVLPPPDPRPLLEYHPVASAPSESSTSSTV